MCAAYAECPLARLGLYTRLGERYRDRDQIRQKLRSVLPIYHRLTDRLITMLIEEGRITVATERSSLPALSQRSRRQCSAPKLTGDSRWLPPSGSAYRTGQHLAEVLSGKIDAVEVLFPAGKIELAERSDLSLCEYLNDLVATGVKSLLACLGDERPHSILEIGAGTGGTTASVLPLLPGQRCRYLYTDISPAFLKRGQARFPNYPFADYRLLDIDKDVEEQEVSIEQYDCVIAANVLHATRQLRISLKHIRQLSRPVVCCSVLKPSARSVTPI